MEDNNEVEDNNKDNNNFKDISALGLDKRPGVFARTSMTSKASAS